MLIEQPPRIYRILYPKTVWRVPVKEQKTVYLTFDDGPIPNITPWVLDILAEHGIKATFFCVGENVEKYPSIYKRILDDGHQVGNHTFNHLRGLRVLTNKYVKNTDLAKRSIKSNLFRPPHGHMRYPQFLQIRKKYKVVMWDVVTRDYSKRVKPQDVFAIVKKYTRNGSILVFHDSIKAETNLKYALPRSIEWLKKEGYSFGVIS